MTGHSVGTPTYMSPEQVAGDGVSPASDQYALGILAYEMLTGKPPFEHKNAMAMMFSHVHQSPAPLEQKRPDCPQPLRDAVMRMLEKEPADRWPTVEDAIEAIGTPPPLSYEDPTRSRLIQLARTGVSERLAGVPRTPQSPIPLGRTGPGQRSVAQRVRHGASPLSIGIAVAGLVVAAGSLAVAVRGQRDTAPESAAITPVADSAAPMELVPPSTVTDRSTVERAIAAYAAALESRSTAEVRRAFPGITEAQLAHLVSLFGAGGRLQPRWKTTDVVTRGDSGTARVRGTTLVISGGGNPSDETMDARVILVRTDGEWRIRSFSSR